jgi:transcriptional regulator with XRE-family HTH domain
MDWVRIGLSFRALRKRRGWTQAKLASEVGFSRTWVSAAERGHGDRLTGRALEKLAECIGARLRMQVLWHGEELDRLLDQRHAMLVEAVVRRLNALGWEVFVEVTFHIGPERGSIDILAIHRATAALLIVEVKSVLPDIQAALASLDRKARLGPRIAAERGWRISSVSRLLILPENATTRRRVQLVAATLAAAFPARNVEASHWLRAPSGRLSGILFVPNATDGVKRRTSAPTRAAATHGSPDESSRMRASRDI